MTNLELLVTPPSEILEKWLQEARAAGLDVQMLEDLVLAVRELEESFSEKQTVHADLMAAVDFGIAAMPDDESERFRDANALKMVEFFVQKAEDAETARQQLVKALEALIQDSKTKP
jgi:hypothetical protein